MSSSSMPGLDESTHWTAMAHRDEKIENLSSFTGLLHRPSRQHKQKPGAKTKRITTCDIQQLLYLFRRQLFVFSPGEEKKKSKLNYSFPPSIKTNKTDTQKLGEKNGK